MTNSQIQCFLSAAQTKNFTETAELLHFLPQTVSKNIRALEDALETTLFRRINNRLELTDSGVHYYQVFSQLLNEFSAAVDKSNFRNAERAKHLCIAYSELVDSMGELLPVVNRFRQLNPGLHISGLQSDVITALRSKKADVAIILAKQPFRETDFYTRRIVQAPEKLFVSPHVLRMGVAKTIDPNCWGVPFLQSYNGTATRVEYLYSTRRMLEQVGLYPKTIELLPNIQSVIATLHVSPCVALLCSRFGIMGNVPDVAKLDVPNALDVPWLCCVWRRTCENPLVEAFVEFLSRELN